MKVPGHYIKNQPFKFLNQLPESQKKKKVASPKTIEIATQHFKHQMTKYTTREGVRTLQVTVDHDSCTLYYGLTQ